MIKVFNKRNLLTDYYTNNKDSNNDNNKQQSIMITPKVRRKLQ